MPLEVAATTLATIVYLLYPRSPSNVPRFVASVVVDAVQTVVPSFPGLRPLADVG
jgi:hypothetical protein